MSAQVFKVMVNVLSVPMDSSGIPSGARQVNLLVASMADDPLICILFQALVGVGFEPMPHCAADRRSN